MLIISAGIFLKDYMIQALQYEHTSSFHIILDGYGIFFQTNSQLSYP